MSRPAVDSLQWISNWRQSFAMIIQKFDASAGPFGERPSISNGGATEKFTLFCWMCPQLLPDSVVDHHPLLLSNRRASKSRSQQSLSILTPYIELSLLGEQSLVGLLTNYPDRSSIKTRSSTAKLRISPAVLKRVLWWSKSSRSKSSKNF